MRVAVMSDIHGFNLALERVLADLALTGPFDEVVVAGDLCEVGPAPRQVVESLAAAPLTVLIGNTDYDIVEASQTRRGEPGDRYAAREIGKDGVAYLASLPFSRRITPPGGTSPDDDLLVVHANPHDLRRRLNPELSDREVREVLGDAAFAALAFGHHHVAYQREIDGRLLVDVSAVGNPKDEDLRSRYGIFVWDDRTARWSAELRYVDYPVEETVAQIEASDLPQPKATIRKLLRASY